MAPQGRKGPSVGAGDNDALIAIILADSFTQVSNTCLKTSSKNCQAAETIWARWHGRPCSMSSPRGIAHGSKQEISVCANDVIPAAALQAHVARAAQGAAAPGGRTPHRLHAGVAGLQQRSRGAPDVPEAI